MNGVDPALKVYWDSQTPDKPDREDRKGPRGRAARLPLTQHPAIRQMAMARFTQDEAAAQVAAMQVKRAPLAWDIQLFIWTGRLVFRPYERMRSFVTAHAGFVSAQIREYRLTACRGCTFRKDRGDGVMYCPPMLAKCKCPVWVLACIAWVTWLRKTECPIGRWNVPKHLEWEWPRWLLACLAWVSRICCRDVPKETTGRDADASPAMPRKTRSSCAGGKPS